MPVSRLQRQGIQQVQHRGRRERQPVAQLEDGLLDEHDRRHDRAVHQHRAGGEEPDEVARVRGVLRGDVPARVRDGREQYEGERERRHSIIAASLFGASTW